MHPGVQRCGPRNYSGRLGRRLCAEGADIGGPAAGEGAARQLAYGSDGAIHLINVGPGRLVAHVRNAEYSGMAGFRLGVRGSAPRLAMRAAAQPAQIDDDRDQ